MAEPARDSCRLGSVAAEQACYIQCSWRIDSGILCGLDAREIFRNRCLHLWQRPGAACLCVDARTLLPQHIAIRLHCAVAVLIVVRGMRWMPLVMCGLSGV